MSLRDPYHPEQVHNDLFKRIQDDIKGINDHMLDCARQIERVEASTKQAHLRITERADEIKIISSLAHSVKQIADEMKEVKESIKINSEDIATLKKAPGDIAIKAWMLILVPLAALVVGYFVGGL